MVLDFGLLTGLFPASEAVGEGFAPIVNQIIWKDVGIGIVPIGAIVAWAKSLDAGIPPLLPNFVECNGQVLADQDSPFNGATIPDLNSAIGGDKGRFLRGDATSGTTQTSQNLAHTHGIPSRHTGSNSGTNGSGSLADTRSFTSDSDGGTETRPNSYTVVWVMRIK